MNEINTKVACQDIIKTKTTVTVVGNNTDSLLQSLEEKISSFNLQESITINKVLIGEDIEDSDVFIIKSEGIPYKRMIQTIIKIYNLSALSRIFVFGKIETARINKDLNTYINFKSNRLIQACINPDDKDLIKVIECLSSIEITKHKINQLWNKLEQIND